MIRDSMKECTDSILQNNTIYYTAMCGAAIDRNEIITVVRAVISILLELGSFSFYQCVTERRMPVAANNSLFQMGSHRRHYSIYPAGTFPGCC